MKNRTFPLIAAASVALSGLASCDEHKHDHGESGHKHEDKHEHAKKQAGPNGGRVLHEFEPHVEFFVTKERKVQLTFLTDDLKAIPADKQVANVIAGERSAPTMLKFTKVGDVLVSDGVLPASDNFPVIVQVKPKTVGKKVSAKFQADMRDCPTCDYLEYACICDHAHDDDHKHE